MKTVPMTKTVCGFDGKPMKDGASSDPKAPDLEIGSVYLAALGRFQGPDGKQNIAAYHLGLKIHQARLKEEKTLELEDAEFELLKTVVEFNGPQFVALVAGQVGEMLNKVSDGKRDTGSK